MTTPGKVATCRQQLGRYGRRVAQTAETHRGKPRPDVLRELLDATAQVSGCIPIRQLEVLARRISDGEDIDTPAEEHHIA